MTYRTRGKSNVNSREAFSHKASGRTELTWTPALTVENVNAPWAVGVGALRRRQLKGPHRVLAEGREQWSWVNIDMEVKTLVFTEMQL